MGLITKAYAKLNLWLDITGRRPDGYHTLNTIMRSIDLYDTVEIETNGSGDIIVSCDDPDIPTDERNCAYKAARLFFSEMEKNMGAYIRISKRIPVGAGLGGSSADGAAVLKGLNEMCGFPFGMDKLYALCAHVGADVPFCMHGGAAACTGIGDRMNAIDCCDFSALIAFPGFACSTSDAYRRYDITPIPEKNGFDEYRQTIASNRSFLAENMYNIFELLYDIPKTAYLKEALISAGAEGACMTGSGSAVFGIFPDKQAAQKAADSLTDCTAFAVNAI